MADPGENIRMNFTRIGTCLACEREGPLQAHHTDYVLDVTVEVCANCHVLIHAGRIRTDLRPVLTRGEAKVLRRSRRPLGRERLVAVFERRIAPHLEPGAAGTVRAWILQLKAPSLAEALLMATVTVRGAPFEAWWEMLRALGPMDPTGRSFEPFAQFLPDELFPGRAGPQEPRAEVTETPLPTIAEGSPGEGR